MSQVTPIRLYGPHDIAEIESCVRQPMSDWTARWLIRSAPPEVWALPWSEASLPRPLRCVGDAADAWIGVACIADQAREIAGGLIGRVPAVNETAGSVLAVAEAALHELSCAMLAALLDRSPSKDTPVWTRHAGEEPKAARWGDVDLHLRVCGAELRFVLGARAVGRLLQRRSGSAEDHAVDQPLLVARRAAIEQARVRLELTLAATEIGLPDLLSMRAGDLVMFPHRVGEPVLLSTSDGKSVAKAVLGARSGRRAAQLIDE